jgi:hypothetical protein
MIIRIDNSDACVVPRPAVALACDVPTHPAPALALPICAASSSRVGEERRNRQATQRGHDVQKGARSHDLVHRWPAVGGKLPKTTPCGACLLACLCACDPPV